MSGQGHAADVREWLRRAFDDLRWARYSFEGLFYPQACFACQQAAEKALKAYLLALDRPLRRIHSLPDLLTELIAKDTEAETLRDDLVVLDTYYAPTRYVDARESTDYTDRVVNDALLRATSVLDWLRPRIEERLQNPGEDS
jgi:HEPN domain-containing protein